MEGKSTSCRARQDARMKSLNNRVGLHRAGLEFRVELAAQEPRVIGDFNDFTSVPSGDWPLKPMPYPQGVPVGVVNS